MVNLFLIFVSQNYSQMKRSPGENTCQPADITFVLFPCGQILSSGNLLSTVEPAKECVKGRFMSPFASQSCRSVSTALAPLRLPLSGAFSQVLSCVKAQF